MKTLFQKIQTGHNRGVGNGLPLFSSPPTDSHTQAAQEYKKTLPLDHEKLGGLFNKNHKHQTPISLVDFRATYLLDFLAIYFTTLKRKPFFPKQTQQKYTNIVFKTKKSSLKNFFWHLTG